MRPPLRAVPLGLLLILAAWVAWTVLLLAAPVLWRILGGADPATAVASVQVGLQQAHPGAVALLLAGFGGLWPGVWLAMRVANREPAGRLLAPRGERRAAEFAAGLGLGLAACAATLLPVWLAAGAPVRTELPWPVWAGWLAPLALLILVQAGGEELVFRGWLTRTLAQRSPNPLVWAGLPSLAFGLAHYAPGLPGASGPLYVATTTVFGLTAAALVWRTGGLAAAIGLHAGINLSGLTLVGLDGVLPGARLWSYPADLGERLLVADLAASVLLLAVVLSPLCPVGRAPRAG